MKYLNIPQLQTIDPLAFQNERPYPWVNPKECLTPEGYDQLRETLPDVSLFSKKFGVQRAHGQQNHDRFTLEYENNLPLAQPWKDFVNELQGKEYRDFLLKLLNISSFELNFHWHYTPNGCSVSPHCDAKHKLGSHIFYFNTEEDWDPSWGGETVILDDRGRFSRKSAPQFEDFPEVTNSAAIGNYSLLFFRNGNSWHGVREIQCPEDRMRKVFIVVINRFTLINRAKRIFGKSDKEY